MFFSVLSSCRELRTGYILLASEWKKACLGRLLEQFVQRTVWRGPPFRLFEVGKLE